MKLRMANNRKKQSIHSTNIINIQNNMINKIHKTTQENDKIETIT
jgi:hypothetical protein